VCVGGSGAALGLLILNRLALPAPEIQRSSHTRKKSTPPPSHTHTHKNTPVPERLAPQTLALVQYPQAVGVDCGLELEVILRRLPQLPC
jgi:hypothetical protein